MRSTLDISLDHSTIQISCEIKTMGIGEVAGLSSAGIWAVSSLLYSFVRMTAWELNFWKNAITTLVLLIHLYLLRAVFEAVPVFEAPFEAWCWLGLSSVVGIVIGDTVYLRSLQILGARRALVVATASPVFGVLIGFFVMHDPITLSLLTGVGLTVFGVGIVVSDKRAEVENPNVFPGRFAVGILLGVGAAVCQASGVAFAKIGMAHGCEALESSFIRISTAAVTMTILLLLYPERYAFSQKGKPFRSNDPTEITKRNPDSLIDQANGATSREVTRLDDRSQAKVERDQNRVSILKPLTDWGTMKYFVPAALLGTWIGIWFFQIAQQYTDTAVVTTLVSTCPIFAIPLVWLFQGHRVSVKGILGTAIAVAGIYFVVSTS